MNNTDPILLMTKDPESDANKIEIKNFSAFRQLVGPDVINSFTRCFVHTNRLTSLLQFGRFSAEKYGQASPAFERDLQTVVWLGVGVLRELARAIHALHDALAKRSLLQAASDPWMELTRIQKRWEDNPFFRKMRDKAAFHVDSDVIEEGICILEKNGDVVLSEGSGHTLEETHYRLAYEALMNGTGKSLEDYERFMEAASEDHANAKYVYDVFAQVIESLDIGSEVVETST